MKSAKVRIAIVTAALAVSFGLQWMLALFVGIFIVTVALEISFWLDKKAPKVICPVCGQERSGGEMVAGYGRHEEVCSFCAD